jgi:PAS domain S-box-containing protein
MWIDQSGSAGVIAPAGRVRAHLAAALGLAAGIFLIDTFTELSSAIAVLYVLVLLIAGEVLSERRIVHVAAVCGLLTALSFVLTHGRDVEVPALLRFIFSLAVLGVTAVLIHRNARARRTLQAQARLLDITRDAIFTCDVSGKIAFWNRGAESLYGWTAKEALGQDPQALLKSSLPQALRDIEATLAATGQWEGEFDQVRRDGQLLTVLSRWSLERNGAGRGGLILQSNTDVTARNQAAEQLRQSEIRYRTIFETLAISIWEHDFRPVKVALDTLRAQGVTDLGAYLAEHPRFVEDTRALINVTDVNQTALNMMGIGNKSDFFTRLVDFLPEGDDSFASFLVAFFEGRSRFEAETKVRTPSGEMIPVIVTFNLPQDQAGLARVQASVLDITERRRMQERLEIARSELEQALRAATLGQLSASIAHEVNQPIAAARAFAEAGLRWLSRDPPDVEEARLALQDVVLAARRTSEVIKRVRDLLKNTPSQSAPVSIDPMTGEAVRLIRSELAQHAVGLELDLQAPNAVLAGDRVLLQQTLINLMTNSVQAMAAFDGAERSLKVRTRVENDLGVIEIEDNGPGFTPEAAGRAFEAFYTTKSQGMGLGLAICRSTIEAHEGRMAILDRKGGATVRLELPLAQGA